jgi:FkbM family methyltransferase
MKDRLLSYARAGVGWYRARRVSRLGEKPSWRKVGRGLVMEIDPSDPMDRAFYLGTYDRPLVMLIDRLVKRGDVSIDIGAHKGYVTLRLARAVGERGRVVAFEPDPRAREHLIRNCEKNRLRNVNVLSCSLGDVNGTCTLMLARQLGHSTRFPHELAAGFVGSTEVAVRTLDGLLADPALRLDLSRLWLIKIDAEGSEARVLRGMQATLASSSPLLWIEINPTALRASGASSRELEQQLIRMGFTFYLPKFEITLLGRRLLFQSVTDIDRQILGPVNVVAFKRDDRSMALRKGALWPLAPIFSEDVSSRAAPSPEEGLRSESS